MNNRWFATTNVILFLNKKDLFEQKIKKVPLTVCFPEFGNSSDYRECIDFVRDKFSYTNKSAASSRHIYHHETCAVRFFLSLIFFFFLLIFFLFNCRRTRTTSGWFLMQCRTFFCPTTSKSRALEPRDFVGNGQEKKKGKKRGAKKKCPRGEFTRNHRKKQTK